jgi:hypothetical protein
LTAVVPTSMPSSTASPLSMPPHIPKAWPARATFGV